jgi:hypothetical protein
MLVTAAVLVATALAAVLIVPGARA